MEPRVFYGLKLTAPLNNRSNGFGLMHKVRCGFDGIPTVRFGAVLRNSGILRYGSVRFSDVVNPTVPFVYIFCPTVRFGAVFRCPEPYGAVRLYFLSYCAVRCGFPI